MVLNLICIYSCRICSVFSWCNAYLEQMQNTVWPICLGPVATPTRSQRKIPRASPSEVTNYTPMRSPAGKRVKQEHSEVRTHGWYHDHMCRSCIVKTFDVSFKTLAHKQTSFQIQLAALLGAQAEAISSTMEVASFDLLKSSSKLLDKSDAYFNL